MRNLANRGGDAARMPRGIELWRGRSRFNNERIVVLASLFSKNEKTGPMIQVWIIRQDRNPVDSMMQGKENATCGDCPLQHKASGGFGLCYVNKLFTIGVWQAWKRGGYPKFNPLKHSKYFINRSLRWGAYGDPAMFPVADLSHIFRLVRGWTGYTHAWRHPFAQDWKPYLMASVETPEGQKIAKDGGWRTFRIRRADEPLMDDERKCPASPEGGQRAICEGCLACDGSARGANLADLSIIIHGKAGNAVRFTRLSVAGRFAESPSLALAAA